MGTIERQVGCTQGANARMQGEGIEFILNILLRECAPDASDRVYHQAAKFLQLLRTDQTMEKCSLEFDIPRRKAEARVQIGTDTPDAFASVLRTQRAPLS